MRLISPQGVDSLDQEVEDKCGIPRSHLMEAAGALVASRISQDYPHLKKQAVLILCGPGGNGGDALVLARYLKASGFGSVECALLTGQLADLTQEQLERLKAFEIPWGEEFPKKSYALIVDGLFGVGLNRELSAEAQSWINQANQQETALRVSLDIPSGLGALQGEVFGSVFCAHRCFSFGLAKPGHYLEHGPECTGELEVIPLSFPDTFLEKFANSCFLFTELEALRLLKKRSPLTNKSKEGHLLVVGGAEGTEGAMFLAARAAERMGLGYISVTSNKEIESKPQFLRARSLSELSAYTGFCVGPGMGKTAEKLEFIQRLKDSSDKPVLLDADALSLCVENELFPLPRDWVITPHAGELSRILGWPSEKIEAQRMDAADVATRVCGCVVVLKGLHTLVAKQDKKYIVHSGNSALAKAGTGDVLAGIISALLAKYKKDSFELAALGVYLHGALADQWVAQNKSEDSLSPLDLIESLPELLAKLKSRL